MILIKMALIVVIKLDSFVEFHCK